MLYVHNHWDEMDEARRQQLLRKNAGLQAELNVLKGQARDPNYQMTGVDADLLYSDAAMAGDAEDDDSLSVVSIGQQVAIWTVLLVILGASVYLIFVKEWSRPLP